MIKYRYENGVWEYTNNETGEVLLVDMGSPSYDPKAGVYRSINPGAPPNISGYTAVAFIHDHPFPDVLTQGIKGFDQPSRADVDYANQYNLQGIEINHNQTYYFGPLPPVEVTPPLIIVTPQVDPKKSM